MYLVTLVSISGTSCSAARIQTLNHLEHRGDLSHGGKRGVTCRSFQGPALGQETATSDGLHGQRQAAPRHRIPYNWCVEVLATGKRTSTKHSAVLVVWLPPQNGP